MGGAPALLFGDAAKAYGSGADQVRVLDGVTRRMIGLATDA